MTPDERQTDMNNGITFAPSCVKCGKRMDGSGGERVLMNGECYQCQNPPLTEDDIRRIIREELTATRQG